MLMRGFRLGRNECNELGDFLNAIYRFEMWFIGM